MSKEWAGMSLSSLYATGLCWTSDFLVTCKCHPSELAKLPSMHIFSGNSTYKAAISIPPKSYLSAPFMREKDPYSPVCATLVRERDDGGVYLPSSLMSNVRSMHEITSDQPSDKKLGSTYLPKSTSSFQDLIVELTFTGTIVIFMLLTLIYLVYKRKTRFNKLQKEMEQIQTMRKEGHKSVTDVKSEQSLFRTLSRSTRTGSMTSNKSALTKKANQLK